MTITSPHNDQLKEIRKLAGRKWRDKLREFVAEGEDLLAAAEAAGWEPLTKLVAEGSGLDGEEVAPHLLAQVSQLGSGTRALGVYPQRWSAPVGPVCVALWGVNDPGNVGTMIRTAAAFDWDFGYTEGTADPWAPKVLRAGAGGHFRLNTTPVETLQTLEDVGLVTIATVVSGGARPADLPEGRYALLVGEEAPGLPPEVVEQSGHKVTIPMPGGMESLNAAMAAGLVIYELSRHQMPCTEYGER